jgi:hypothetical protein
MADATDTAMNTDRPIVQDTEREGYVEIVWPHAEETTVLDEAVVMAMFSDAMRIITGMSPNPNHEPIDDDRH